MLNKENFNIEKIDRQDKYTDYWFSVSEEITSYLYEHFSLKNVIIRNFIFTTENNVILINCEEEGYNYIIALSEDKFTNNVYQELKQIFLSFTKEDKKNEKKSIGSEDIEIKSLEIKEKNDDKLIYFFENGGANEEKLTEILQKEWFASLEDFLKTHECSYDIGEQWKEYD